MSSYSENVQTVPSRVGPACWLVVLIAAQIFGFAMVYRFFVETRVGQRLETAALAGNVIGQARIENLVRGVLDFVSVGALAAAIIVVAFIALARKRIVLALVTAMMVAGSNVTTQLLKHGLLGRPSFGIDFGGKDNPTLPSGHTTVAMSAAVALVLVLPPRLRGTAALAGAGYAALTGVATLSAGWHRPSDAITAYLVVGIWTAFAGLVLLAAQTWKARPSIDDAHPVAVTMLAFAGVSLIAVGTLALMFADRSINIPVLDLSRRQLFVAYAGSAAAIAGSAALVMSLILVALHRVVPSYRRAPEPHREPEPYYP